ncbi:hypothetical protein [Devosia psychrophila]|uniref:Uncharacterized protein n=1 Tax=Devosia psychrophila TaxID=728005 RepID=A0A1I1RI75_9HYPH|nr:hypothetical protein [Devosia psychrophila]SFD30190.1 hypothetical protein SAMN04488059_13811 [Devosia psychrophila]
MQLFSVNSIKPASEQASYPPYAGGRPPPEGYSLLGRALFVLIVFMLVWAAAAAVILAT